MLACAPSFTAVALGQSSDLKEQMQSAATGDELAQLELAIRYVKGDGVPQDYARAFDWFQKSAMQGCEIAQVRLGTMYFSGKGVPMDFVRAYAWWNVASSRGDPDATDLRNGIGRRMTPEQIADAQKLSTDLAAKIPKAQRLFK